jgi:multiple sugar transport system substrate-binding protein
MGDTDGWAAGKYAMELDGPWRQASNNAAGIKLRGHSSSPGDEGSISVLGGENFMMFKTSPDEEKSRGLGIHQILSRRTRASRDGQTWANAVNKDALENAEAVTAMPLLPVFAEALETARARPVIPEWGDIENIIAASVAEAITGAKAVQTALDEAVTAINAILAG